MILDGYWKLELKKSIDASAKDCTITPPKKFV